MNKLCIHYLILGAIALTLNVGVLFAQDEFPRGRTDPPSAQNADQFRGQMRNQSGDMLNERNLPDRQRLNQQRQRMFQQRQHRHSSKPDRMRQLNSDSARQFRNNINQ